MQWRNLVCSLVNIELSHSFTHFFYLFGTDCIHCNKYPLTSQCYCKCNLNLMECYSYTYICIKEKEINFQNWRNNNQKTETKNKVNKSAERKCTKSSVSENEKIFIFCSNNSTKRNGKSYKVSHSLTKDEVAQNGEIHKIKLSSYNHLFFFFSFRIFSLNVHSNVLCVQILSRFFYSENCLLFSLFCLLVGLWIGRL